MIYAAFLVGTFASFNFNMRAIQKLYMVKSEDNKLFSQTKNKKFIKRRLKMLKIAKSEDNVESAKAKNTI